MRRLVVILLLLLMQDVRSCTLVVVGRQASFDGKTTFVAHTDDAGGGASDLRLVRVPSSSSSSSSRRRPVFNFKGGYPRLVTSGRGPHYQSVHNQSFSMPLGFLPSSSSSSYAYFDLDYGMMNEVQLSIGESTCGARTVGFPIDPTRKTTYGKNMMGIAELSKIALERCDNARCAIKTMGELAVTYGFFSEDSGTPDKPGYSDSAETLGIADKYGEAWIFHVLTDINNQSAIWAAQRVPDNHVCAVANGFVIRQMNLSDPDQFLASPNVKSSALKMGWWDPKAGPFDFTAAYGYSGSVPLYPLYVGRRVWRVYDIFAPSLKLDSTLGYEPLKPTYPFSVKPDSPIKLDQIVQLLKDHYEGTPYDMTKGISAGPFGNPVRFDGPASIEGGWERSISIYRSVFSFILQAKAGVPDHIGGVAWFGLDAPHGTVYVPFSSAQNNIPESYLIGKQSEFDTRSAWWAFNFVNNWSCLKYNMISKDVRSEMNRLQQKAYVLQNELEKKQYQSYSKNVTNIYEKARNDFADEVVSNWWNLAWRLVSKFSDGYVTTGEDSKDTVTPGYPSWWLEATSFSKWPGVSYRPPKTISTSSAPAHVPGHQDIALSSAQVQYPHHYFGILFGSFFFAIGVLANTVYSKYRIRNGYQVIE